MPLAVVRTWRDTKKLDPRQNALLEVPGEWVGGIAGLLRLGEEFRDTGLIVTNVGPSGAGARAGIARGDVMLRYDGVDLDRVATLREITGRSRPGQKARIEAMRGDRERHFEVESGPLGVTVSAPLHRLMLAAHASGGSRGREPLMFGSWKPS